MNDENEEDDINDDYASSFGSFFDDIGAEKNSEQELIDKVLKIFRQQILVLDMMNWVWNFQKRIVFSKRNKQNI